MIVRKLLATAGTVALSAGLGFGLPASASSPGCAFGNGCATLHGFDAASHQVALDAKYQNRNEILIGYPDNPGDGASSFDGALHFTPNGKTVTYADTALQVQNPHFVSGACSFSAPSLSADTLSVPSTETLSVHANSSGLTESGVTSQSVTFSGNTWSPGTNLLVIGVSENGCTEAFIYQGSLASPVTDQIAPGGITYTGGSNVQFSAHSVQSATSPPPAATAVPGFRFDSGLPAGIVGDLADGKLTANISTAIPNAYSSVGVTYTDSYGASESGAFELVVSGNKVVNKNPDKPYYTFVYAPRGTWTSRCVTDVNGSGALRLEPCTLGRDKYQDFFALNGSGSPVQIADGITAYHFQNWLASVANPSSCLTDPSSLNPGSPQSDATDEATSPAGRQLRTDGSCTASGNLWSWNT